MTANTIHDPAKVRDLVGDMETAAGELVGLAEVFHASTVFKGHDLHHEGLAYLVSQLLGAAYGMQRTWEGLWTAMNGPQRDGGGQADG